MIDLGTSVAINTRTNNFCPLPSAALMVCPSDGIYLFQKLQAIYLKWLLFSKSALI